MILLPSIRKAFRPRNVVLGVLLFHFLLFATQFWLSQRAGPEYYGTPEKLLPPDTAAMATWLDLNRFLENANQLQALRKIRGDEDLAALLLTNSTWRTIQKEKDKVHYKLLTRMANDFVHKWLGREVTVALVPPRSGAPAASTGPNAPDNPANGADGATTATAPQSGLLVIARTDIGFEENLAELVLHYYPELSLETREYREHRIHRYNAEKSRRAFSYCRFGKTVVVSLRSADWSWIEGVVDRKIGESPDGANTSTLAGAPEFQASAPRREIDDGLGVFLQPQRLIRALVAFPSQKSPGPSEMFWYDYLGERLADVEWSAWKLVLDHGLRLESFWKTLPSENVADGEPKPSGGNSTPQSPLILKTYPADSAVVLLAESGELAWFLRDMLERMDRIEDYEECLEDFEDGWTETTGTEFSKDWLEPMGSTVGMALTGLAGAKLIPIPKARAWWEFESSAAAARTVDMLESRKPNIFSILYVIFSQLDYRAEGRTVHLELNEKFMSVASPVGESKPGSEETAASGADASAQPAWRDLSGHPLLADLWAPDRPHPVFCFFVNFESGYEYLVRLHATAQVWSKDVRENVAWWETLLGVIRHFHALRLTAAPEAEGVKIDLLISVD